MSERNQIANDSERARFLASFPDIQSAIKIHGRGDGMRIQLEIPESEMGNAADLIRWRNSGLEVTVRPVGKKQGSW